MFYQRQLNRAEANLYRDWITNRNRFEQTNTQIRQV